MKTSIIAIAFFSLLQVSEAKTEHPQPLKLQASEFKKAIEIIENKSMIQLTSQEKETILVSDFSKAQAQSILNYSNKNILFYGKALTLIMNELSKRIPLAKTREKAYNFILANSKEKNVYKEEHNPKKIIGLGVKIKNLELNSKKLPEIESVISPRTFYGYDVRPGDLIVEVNGISSLLLESKDELISSIRGPEETEVKIKFQRGDLVFEKAMERIRMEEMIVSLTEIVNEVAIIKIDRFINLEQITRILDTVMKFKPKGIILDLRENGGGDPVGVKLLVSLFASKGHLAYSEKKPTGIEKLTVLEDGPYLGTKMAVLVSSQTAGAAEAAAASLQSLGYPIIGEKTPGIAFKESIFDINAEIALSLVGSSLLLPDGSELAGQGITPNIIEKDPKEQITLGIEAILKAYSGATKSS